MIARVYIKLRPSILDVQGKAIEKSIAQLGLGTVEGIRVGKTIEVPIPDDKKNEAEHFVRELCQSVLVSPITEQYEIEFLN